MNDLVCLLPVRNVEADLPLYLEAASQFIDAVVALDDGSNDSSSAILEQHPLVKILISNPPRADYRGWDDSRNRQRLLEAAGKLNPKWILSLDADEIIDGQDALALRSFLEAEGVQGVAYGFTVHRMIGDMEHFDRGGLWVYRLFAFRHGQEFPSGRLHFQPVPLDIPPERWVKTTVRIKHRAGLTAERRRARYNKYLEADPDNLFQEDYGNLLDPPVKLKPWKPRPPNLPVLSADRKWTRWWRFR